MPKKGLLEAVGKYIEKYYVPDVEDIREAEVYNVEFEKIALLSIEENDARAIEIDEIFEDEALAETEVLSKCKTKAFGARSNAMSTQHRKGKREDSKVGARLNATVAKRKIDDLMTQMEETFSMRLLRLITEKGMTDSEAYAKAYIDRRHFSKIRNDMHYSPNKKTVLAFAIALELSLDETKDLLSSAGFALSRSSKGDVIVSYFLENKIYDMFEINEILEAYGQPVFE